MSSAHPEGAAEHSLRCTPGQLKALLKMPHNPPVFGADFKAVDFSEEWHTVNDKVQLLFRGRRKEFFVVEDWTYSRRILVEVADRRLVSHALIRDLQRLLAKLTEDYEIVLASGSRGLVEAITIVRFGEVIRADRK